MRRIAALIIFVLLFAPDAHADATLVQPVDVSGPRAAAPASEPSSTPSQTASDRSAAAEAEQFKWSDWVTAAATAVTGIFTGLLWVSTQRLWKESVRAGNTAEKSADAAKASADALMASERAYIFAHVDYVSHVLGTDLRANVVFTNHGRTPAIILVPRAYPLIDSHVPQALIDHPHANDRAPAALPIHGNGGQFILPVQQAHLTGQQYAALEGLQEVLYVVGLLRYEDVNGAEHETGFCWEYRPNLQSPYFHIARGSALNYRT